MSQESQKIAVLRDRLALIESTQVNENPLKTGFQTMKNLFKGSKPAAPTPPSTTPPGRVNTARPNNPNAPYKEVPGAQPVTKDLTGAPVNPGGISATGSVGANRAQAAADAQLAAQRAASKDALGAMRPNPVGGAATKPVGSAGSTAANALKNNPGKTAAAAGAVGAAAGAGGVAAVTGGAATKPADADGAPSGASGASGASGSLAPEEQKELDALAAELEVHMGRLPELDDLLLKHQALSQGGAATKPAANPELDAIKKNAGIPASANDGNAGEAEAQAAMAAKQPAPASANDGNAGEAEAQAAMAAKQPAPGTTRTQSNQSVQGTMTMGKPDGPITFNGKVVQPGAPEYAAASAALIKAQGASQQARQQRFTPKTGAAPAAPVQQGAAKVSASDF